MMENAYIHGLDLITSVWQQQRRRRPSCIVEWRQRRKRRLACTRGRAAVTADEPGV
jgi:hypothetical protein